MTPVALFASELGGGLGHIARLNSAASVARDLGCRTVLATPPGAATLRPPSEWHFDAVIEGPRLPRLSKAPVQLNVGGLASNLARTGFIDKRRIGSVIAAWHDLLIRSRPAVVVGDFAPYARLACLERIPFLMVGSGYTLPPASGLLPFAMERTARDPSRVARRIVSQVNAALDAIGTGAIDDASACLRGDRNVVACLPFLDPAERRDAEERIGPLEPLPDRCSATAGARKMYAYLHSATEDDLAVLSGLASEGFRIDVFCDADAGRREPIGKRLDAPLDPRRIVADYALVYHHAGLGLATQCLLAGLPQVLNPRHLEASFTAARIEREGFGVDLSKRGRTPISNPSEGLLDLPSIDTRRIELLRSWVVGRDWRQTIGALLRRLA